MFNINLASRSDDMLAMQVGLKWPLEIADEGIIHPQSIKPVQAKELCSNFKKIASSNIHAKDHNILDAKYILQHSKSQITNQITPTYLSGRVAYMKNHPYLTNTHIYP